MRENRSEPVHLCVRFRKITKDSQRTFGWRGKAGGEKVKRRDRTERRVRDERTADLLFAAS
jgi:hypothetical protein